MCVTVILCRLLCIICRSLWSARITVIAVAILSIDVRNSLSFSPSLVVLVLLIGHDDMRGLDWVGFVMWWDAAQAAVAMMGGV
jgi:hypothetical protein